MAVGRASPQGIDWSKLRMKETETTLRILMATLLAGIALAGAPLTSTEEHQVRLYIDFLRTQSAGIPASPPRSQPSTKESP